MNGSITELSVGTPGHCPMCGMYLTLGYHDSELDWNICCGCIEHVVRADSILNRIVFIPGMLHFGNPLGLRRPLATEVFP
jgi:hypothetical protein